MGGPKETGEFYRLFMVPGMAHCGGGPGANAFGQGANGPIPSDPASDILSALDRWVELRIAPEKIIATKYVNDDPNQGVAFQRPLCPFPKIAKYKGQGAITTEASSFECSRDGSDRDDDDHDHDQDHRAENRDRLTGRRAQLARSRPPPPRASRRDRKIAAACLERDGRRTYQGSCETPPRTERMMASRNAPPAQRFIERAPASPVSANSFPNQISHSRPFSCDAGAATQIGSPGFLRLRLPQGCLGRARTTASAELLIEGDPDAIHSRRAACRSGNCLIRCRRNSICATAATMRSIRP